LANAIVNRMYRALFVYSLGFYQIIQHCSQHIMQERFHLQSRIWKVYQILLEYCSKTDYELITRQSKFYQERSVNIVELIHKEQVDEMDAKFRE